jgi:hypothetical protein
MWHEMKRRGVELVKDADLSGLWANTAYEMHVHAYLKRLGGSCYEFAMHVAGWAPEIHTRRAVFLGGVLILNRSVVDSYSYDDPYDRMYVIHYNGKTRLASPPRMKRWLALENRRPTRKYEACRDMLTKGGDTRPCPLPNSEALE